MSNQNEMEYKELKEMIANQAVSVLVQGQDYQNLAGINVVFGYLYLLENHGIETLFKVITDRNIIYFAIQGKQMMRLNINEEQFKMYIDQTEKLHQS